jgi:hypothetical protein
MLTVTAAAKNVSTSRWGKLAFLFQLKMAKSRTITIKEKTFTGTKNAATRLYQTK